MSNFVTNADETGTPPETHTQHQVHNQQHPPHNPIAHYSARFLENSDSLIYAIVSISFFLAGLFALGYRFWDFGDAMLRPLGGSLTTAAVAQAIIKLVSDLLLVLIIMEVLGTVIHYLKSHATSLRPFLFIEFIKTRSGVISCAN